MIFSISVGKRNACVRTLFTISQTDDTGACLQQVTTYQIPLMSSEKSCKFLYILGDCNVWCL